MADVFISYAREDEPFVHQLADVFLNQGFSVFWDRKIAVGQTWRSVISRELHDARCVVVVWSNSSVASDFVAEEADDGKSRGILHPVLSEKVQVPLGFRSIQCADLTARPFGTESAAVQQLLDDIRSTLARSSRIANGSEVSGKFKVAIDHQPVKAPPHFNTTTTSVSQSSPLWLLALLALLSAVICILLQLFLPPYLFLATYVTYAALVFAVASYANVRLLREGRRALVATVVLTGIGTALLWHLYWRMIAD